MKVVVDAFDPSLLVSNTNIHVMDFSSMAEEELYDIYIPLKFDLGLSPFLWPEMKGVFVG